MPLNATAAARSPVRARAVSPAPAPARAADPVPADVRAEVEAMEVRLRRHDDLRIEWGGASKDAAHHFVSCVLAGLNKAKGAAPAKLYVHADPGASLTDVGHAWISLEFPDSGIAESVGFYPRVEGATIRGTSGAGRILSPDDHAEDTAKGTQHLAVDVNPRQILEVLKYVESGRSHEYALLGFNCTQFAAAVYRAATGGLRPPGGDRIMGNHPWRVAKSIRRRNAKTRAKT